MLQIRILAHSRGVSGDDPEGGAGSGVLRWRLVTARLGRPGTPPARHYDLAARSSLHGSGRQLPAVVGRRAPKETEARPRGPKPPRWSAERRASSVMANSHSSMSLHIAPLGYMYLVAALGFNAIALHCARSCPTPIFGTLARHGAPFPCPSRAPLGLKAPPPDAAWRCGGNLITCGSRPASIWVSGATPAPGPGACASPGMAPSGSRGLRSRTILNPPTAARC